MVTIEPFILEYDSKLRLKVIEPNEEVTYIDIKGGVRMEKVIFAYAFKNRLHPPSVKFYMHDIEILGDETPESLNMDELQEVTMKLVERT